MFWCKKFETKYGKVVALCDEELLGKKIVSKEFNVEISKDFYGERRVDERAALRMLKTATMGNFFGKRAVALAEKNGFILNKNIIFINGIPHAQFIKI